MFDVYAVAWGIVLYNFISIFINLAPSKNLVDYGCGEQLKDVLPTFIASLIMGGVVFSCTFLPFDKLIVLCIQILMGISSYYLLSIMMKLDGYAYVLMYANKELNRD